MKNVLLLYGVLLSCSFAVAQEKDTITEITEQQLEALAEANTAVTGEDIYLQQFSHFKQHPLNINSAGAGELALLPVLNAWQKYTADRH